MIRRRGAAVTSPIMVIVKFTSNVTYAESNLEWCCLASDQTEVVEGNHYHDTIIRSISSQVRLTRHAVERVCQLLQH